MRMVYIILAGLLAASCSRSIVKYDAAGVFETTEVVVSSQGAGQIIALDIKEGDDVTAGQKLGFIDKTQLELNKKQLQAAIKSAESRIMNIDRQLAPLQEQIATQKREKERFSRLVRSEAANQKQLDDINSQLSYLERQLVAQSETMNKNNQAIYNEIEALTLQIAQVDDKIAKSDIVSPLSGVVLAKYAEAGEFSQVGKPLFKVANTKDFYLKAYITNDQITKLKLGDGVWVYADFGKPNEAGGVKMYDGVVAYISDKAEFTPKTIPTRNERANLVYEVKINVVNDGFLKKGMYGEVKLGK